MTNLNIIGKSRTIGLSNIKMLVFDMAGTTVNEHGIVYQTMFSTLSNYGLGVKQEEIDKWHGANKSEVFNHYLNKSDIFKMHSETYQNNFRKEIYDKFYKSLEEQYFTSNKISLIHEDLPKIFTNIRESGIKIALNTGYNKSIQSAIINKLGMNEFIDDYISSEEVSRGRPYPYMIHSLMERNNIKTSKEVIKFGDTKNDIIEGINARCLASIGVLSGADNHQTLSNSTIIIDDITKIEL